MALDQIDPIQAKVAELQLHAEAAGFIPSWDGFVNEREANHLLGYRSRDTLRKQHEDGKCNLDYRQRGNRRFYSLVSLATHIVGGMNRS